MGISHQSHERKRPQDCRKEEAQVRTVATRVFQKAGQGRTCPQIFQKAGRWALSLESTQPRARITLRTGLRQQIINKFLEIMSQFILYLQPSNDTALWTCIQEFYKVTKMQFGPNEAHQYHPHISLTGFWNVSDVDRQPDQYYIEFISPLVPPTIQVTVQPPLLVAKGSTQSLILPVETDSTIKSFPSRVLNLKMMGCDPIRVKNVDHISLAYGPGFVADTKLVHLASERISTEAIKCQEWDLVLYERIFKSKDLDVPHQFREIKSWKLVNTPK